jgi:hypothetical protein
MDSPEIVLTALGASLLVPIGMAFLPPSTARRTALVAWAILLPILAVNCLTMTWQGARGFLITSQALSTCALFLAMSVGFGYGASKVFHAKSPVKPEI